MSPSVTTLLNVPALDVPLLPNATFVLDPLAVGVAVTVADGTTDIVGVGVGVFVAVGVGVTPDGDGVGVAVRVAVGVLVAVRVGVVVGVVASAVQA